MELICSLPSLSIRLALKRSAHCTIPLTISSHRLKSSSRPLSKVAPQLIDVEEQLRSTKTTNKPIRMSLKEALRKHNPVVFKPSEKHLITFLPVVEVAERTLERRRDHHDMLYNQNHNLVHGDQGIQLLNAELLQWREIEAPTAKDLGVYWLRLSKFRLTSLVVLTTLAGFTMGVPAFAGQSSLLAATLVGTALTSSSAAALNQYLEIPFDSQMVRTRARPLVVGQVSPLHALLFTGATGLSGLAILTTMVNPLTAALGATNWILYTCVYTPMKRANILNTWIGSFVGAIPPLMGYTAATGLIDPAGLMIGLILYSWQFPHFNALSWNLRHDYARAGYRMMSVTNPDLCLNTAFRHSILLTAYCLISCHPAIGLTNYWFAMDSLPFNAYLVYLSYKFKKEPTAASSRKLFRFSLIHLPAIILVMILGKKARDGLVEEQVALNPVGSETTASRAFR